MRMAASVLLLVNDMEIISRPTLIELRQVTHES